MSSPSGDGQDINIFIDAGNAIEIGKTAIRMSANGARDTGYEVIINNNALKFADDGLYYNGKKVLTE